MSKQKLKSICVSQYHEPKAKFSISEFLKQTLIKNELFKNCQETHRQTDLGEIIQLLNSCMAVEYIQTGSNQTRHFSRHEKKMWKFQV